MTQDPRDDRLLGDGGNDPERAASAQGARSHIQSKHPLQQAEFWTAVYLMPELLQLFCGQSRFGTIWVISDHLIKLVNG